MTFLYSPLLRDSIRLLHFLDDTGFSCTMRTYSLKQAPPYICLSYTWGRPPSENSPACSITLNDPPFSVQQNLHDALRHLGKRVRKRDQAFWVDAICINQKDKDERGVQVQQMKEIYECSAAVFAWLGVPLNEKNMWLGEALMQDFLRLFQLQPYLRNPMRIPTLASPSYPREVVASLLLMQDFDDLETAAAISEHERKTAQENDTKTRIALTILRAEEYLSNRRIYLKPEHGDRAIVEVQDARHALLPSTPESKVWAAWEGLDGLLSHE
jgi:hypothetical protein